MEKLESKSKHHKHPLEASDRIYKGAFVSTSSTNQAGDSEAESLLTGFNSSFSSVVFVMMVWSAAQSYVSGLLVSAATASSSSGVARPPRDVTASGPSPAS